MITMYGRQIENVENFKYRQRKFEVRNSNSLGNFYYYTINVRADLA